ncbi:hypothetical protein Q9L42_000630 [Methylomarinum sp. Ch1-1]|uniref:Uncharacterized protein n=1 Tax=Methylomarinum roseum TaxID=3067653 RepID=A0AAU7NUL6_9GAMM|nr:hypothetical protein [Methylomarinum sp. Ch1-1]MDP4519255.1 hypothetical protein [Methylomarinum sp. Ch1-1]
MDNDTLINQARRLYTALSVEQYLRSLENKDKFNRLDRLVIWAYCRYQRRLNRCVLCYQHRKEDCSREPEQNKRRLCPALNNNRSSR